MNKPTYQNPDANVDVGYRMPADEDIDFTIQWASPVVKENKEPASSREIIELMNELRQEGVSTTIDSPVSARGRHEVIKEVAKQIEERELGFCLINFNEDGARFNADKGIWESGIHVFATEGAMKQYLENF